MAHDRFRVYSKSKIITLLNVQPTAQQMHASYLLMTRAHDQGYVPGHVHKVRESIPELCCYFHSCAKGLSEEDRLEQIKHISALCQLQWKWKKMAEQMEGSYF